MLEQSAREQILLEDMCESEIVEALDCKRDFKKLALLPILLISVVMVLFHLYTGGVRPYPAIIQRGVHLHFGLILTFMYSYKPQSKR